MAFDFRSPGGTIRREEIEHLARSISISLDHLAENLGIEVGTTTVTLSDDLPAEVERVRRDITLLCGDSEPPPFTVERLGGSVVGKTLPHDEAYRDATVVIPARDIAWEDGPSFALGIGLLAHELSHVCISRARFASGALDGVLLPSRTGTEYARGIARNSSEEYRATILGDIALGSCLSITVRTEAQRPMTFHDLLGDSHTDRVIEILDEVVYPGWPDIVSSYQHGRIDLNGLTKLIVEGTDQVFTSLGHAESHAEVGERPRPLDVCAGHRAVELYLRPAWERSIAPARAAPALPDTLADVLALEERIIAEGEAAILGLWSTLGLSIEERADRQWALWVSDPQR